MHFQKMSGGISAWSNLFICVVVVIVALGDWTAGGIGGVAAQHQRLVPRQDEYQSTNDREGISNAASDYRGGPPVKDPPAEVNEEDDEASLGSEDGYEANPPIPSAYRSLQAGVERGDTEEEDESQLATRFGLDKRGPSNYKLKYGGLGKRKLSSNSLRYGGLGKRLQGKAADLTSETEAQEREELGNGKPFFETAYFFLDKANSAGTKLDDAVDDFPAPISETTYDTPADHPEIPMLAGRQQRSRMGSGMRYAGLGKRRLKV